MHIPASPTPSVPASAAKVPSKTTYVSQEVMDFAVKSFYTEAGNHWQAFGPFPEQSPPITSRSILAFAAANMYNPLIRPVPFLATEPEPGIDYEIFQDPDNNKTYSRCLICSDDPSKKRLNRWRRLSARQDHIREHFLTHTDWLFKCTAPGCQKTFTNRREASDHSRDPACPLKTKGRKGHKSYELYHPSIHGHLTVEKEPSTAGGVIPALSSGTTSSPKPAGGERKFLPPTT